MSRRTRLLIVTLLLVAIAVAGMIQLAFGQQEEMISQEQMTEMIESRYVGEVTSIALAEEAGKEVYRSTLRGHNGAYQIEADAFSGQIVRIMPLEVASAKPTGQQPSEQANQSTGQQGSNQPSPSTGQQPSSQPNQSTGQQPGNQPTQPSGEQPSVQPSPPPDQENTGAVPKTPVSAEKAEAIALMQINGTVDGIELEDVNGTLVYEVEIETPDDDEVKVQVDAYTGQVLSVLWEDD